jgi:hypothetical protein
MKRSDMTDDEFGAKLVKGYDAAAAAAENFADPNHPRHAVNAWLASARGAPAEDDEGDQPLGGGGPGATDAAIVKAARQWRSASTPVRIALDKAYATPGNYDVSARLGLAEAELRMQGFAGDEAMLRELHSYASRVTKEQHGEGMKIAGYDRLR